MGVYSKEATKAFLKSDTLLGKASEDYYKSKMFYGNIQAYIDASNQTEAKYLAARAINDFDTFCKCYTPDNSEKLNGIVVKPVGETSNEFIACTTDINGNRSFEHVIIREGNIVNVSKNTVVREAEEEKPTEEDKSEETKKEETPKEDKNIEVKEAVNLARDF